MSGYRDTSNYEPFAGPDYGRPLRPFNKWQWVGVGCGIVGVLVMLGTLAARLDGMAADSSDWLPLGTTLCALGTVLINSRRETLSAEQTAERRRRALIVLAIAFLFMAIAFATIFVFKGA